MMPSGALGSAPLLGECVPEFKAYIARYRAELGEHIGRPDEAAGVNAGERAAKIYDGLLCSVFRAAQAATERAHAWHPVSVAAVGSYGRGVLGLHSDLDVRLLCPDQPERAKAIAEALLTPLWDAGLSIGHQVTTADDLIELAYKDLPTATSLLDWRPVAGEVEVSEKLLLHAHKGVFGIEHLREFLAGLELGARERYERFGGSVYLLEPDVKNGPGGLRDLDIALWAAKARFKVRELRDLVGLGILLPREWQPLDVAHAWMWRVRNLLHFMSKRKIDRLSFERQEELALHLGYGEGGFGVERFMSEHYRQARVISSGREMVVGRAMPLPRRRGPVRSLGAGLKLVDEALGLESARALDGDPALAFRLYAEALKRDLPVLPDARDSLARAASAPGFAEALRQSQEAAELFRRLLTSVQASKAHRSVLRDLHDLGLLAAMLPEFEPVIGRVHHDIYHVLTVDAHSVAAVEKLQSLCRGDLAQEYPLATRLALEVARPEVLFFATLLHDVGKDVGGKDHSSRGADLALGILERLRFAKDDILAVQHLVKKHLRMYHVATRREIEDPNTLRGFSEEVHGLEGLRELYLLTLADISTTSPTALTPWKARLLEELYLRTERYLSEGGIAIGREHVEAIREEVRADCSAEGEREFLDYFLGVVPERYLYANKPAAILRHSRFARQAQAKFVNVVALRVEGPYVEVGFVADDRPGLLADITATLAGARLKVVAAQIYSLRDAHGRDRALDLFWVRGGSEPERVLGLVPRLEKDFARLVSHELSGRELVRAGTAGLSRADRPAPRLGTTVTLDPRASTSHTLIEVITQDRPALLFGLASCLQREGLSISLAKISTEGNQVIDVFYVCSRDGEKVTDEGRLEQIKASILSTVQELTQEVSES